jgi:aminoglycoside 6'-N-acetyltransferase I
VVEGGVGLIRAYAHEIWEAAHFARRESEAHVSIAESGIIGFLGQTQMASKIRQARPDDRDALSLLFAALWPEESAEEHAREVTSLLSGKSASVMPLLVWVAEAADGEVVGFIEAGLRSCADGCDMSRPVGYVEGWYVAENCRRAGIGKALLRAAEDWAREQRCTEMASDALLENILSQDVHRAEGFTEVDRAVKYRKAL